MEDNTKSSRVCTKKLWKAGGSVVISIPKEWLDRHKLKPGDEVGIVMSSTLKIVPLE